MTAAPRRDESARSILGEAVVAAAPLRWGFAHHTELLTLADGRRVVVKRFEGPDGAAEIERAVAFGPLLAAAGIPTPAVLAVDGAATPPVLILEFVEGTTGADWLDEPARARTLARTMGELAVRIRGIPVDADAMATASREPWADPTRLTRAAGGWLEAVGSGLPHASLAGVHDAVDHLSEADRTLPTVIAHGDYVPVNVLLGGDGRLAAVLDLGTWRIAHPWLDVAWWGWVVRAHHPDAWATAWSTFLEAAALPDDVDTQRTIRSLQLVALLERAAAPGADPAWRERLATTERWR
jgi:aminoglycoside phosphotransferase (APT) family kinase protein